MVANENQTRMQRVRVGLTGLAAVILVVAAAAAIFESASQEPQAGPGMNEMASASTTQNMIDNGVEVPNEPLAEIGVMPGTETTDAEKAEDATAAEDAPNPAPAPAPNQPPR